MSELSTIALQKAVTQIGQQENPQGSNWGHPVQDYLNAVGIDFPASWCMAFVYWCFNEASKQLGINNPLFRTGGVLRAYNRAVNNVVKDAAIGDIFVIDFGHGLGHTGIIENIEGELLHTIEGNTNDTGSREGYEVCRRVRKISAMKGFIRY